jgi:hypothetical protein
MWVTERPAQPGILGFRLGCRSQDVRSSVDDVGRVTLRVAFLPLPHLCKGCLHKVCVAPFLRVLGCSRRALGLLLLLRCANLQLRTASHCITNDDGYVSISIHSRLSRIAVPLLPLP